MLVIGVDCATQANKTGMVLASWSGAALRFEDAAIGSKRNPCLKVLSWWIGRDPDVLLALDAPLGWPEPLGSALATHSAGKVIREDADDLFSRTTDRRIRERLGKRPFEVGANLIARTAHAALKMLEALRRATGHSIPLVWEGKDFSGVGAIEVYPAATRIAHGFREEPSTVEWTKGTNRRRPFEPGRKSARPGCRVVRRRRSGLPRRPRRGPNSKGSGFIQARRMDLGSLRPT